MEDKKSKLINEINQLENSLIELRNKQITKVSGREKPENQENVRQQLLNNPKLRGGNPSDSGSKVGIILKYLPHVTKEEANIALELLNNDEVLYKLVI